MRMSRLIVIAPALVVSLSIAASTAVAQVQGEALPYESAQLEKNKTWLEELERQRAAYWDSHWSWYDNEYRPYYQQRYSRLQPYGAERYRDATPSYYDRMRRPRVGPGYIYPGVGTAPVTPTFRDWR